LFTPLLQDIAGERFTVLHRVDAHILIPKQSDKKP
jgi:hypothetical protein